MTIQVKQLQHAADSLRAATKDVWRVDRELHSAYADAVAALERAACELARRENAAYRDNFRAWQRKSA